LDSSIANAGDFGKEQVTDILPSDIFFALDQIIWPGNATRRSLEDSQSVKFVLTTYLGTLASASQSSQSGYVQPPMEILRNLLFTPIFLFNPLFLGAGGIDLNSSQLSQPDLPADFYSDITHSYLSYRATPRYGTVLAYAGTGGLLLVLIFAGLLFGFQYESTTQSSYPQLDFASHLFLVSGTPRDVRTSNTRTEKPMRTVFGDTVIDSEILEKAKKLSVIRN
jgi:hypothetical protein